MTIEYDLYERIDNLQTQINELEKENTNLLRCLDGKPTHWSNIIYDKNKEIEKLETKIKLMNDIIGDKENSTKQLKKENAMMREALEFYADRFSWEWSDHPSLEMYSGEIRNDSSLVKYREVDGEEYQNHCGGKRAREVLEKLTKGSE